MLIRLTPKQRGKLKKYLETCELKGTPQQIQFEIKIHEEIKNAIDDFYDEKDYTLIENIELQQLKSKPSIKPGLTMKDEIQKTVQPQPIPEKEESFDLDENEDDLTEDEIDKMMDDEEYLNIKKTKSIVPPRISKQTKEVDDSGGLFTVDYRTKK